MEEVDQPLATRPLRNRGKMLVTVKEAHERIVKEVSQWAGVTAHPHRFGGTEFWLGEKRELGHLHGNYLADIPFPVKIRDRLISEKRAEPHHILPESGWVSFHIRFDDDVERAVELFKLSYELAIHSQQ